MGTLRFLFKSPASVKVWARKYLLAAVAGQFIFLICCAMLTSTAYKVLYGGQLWEFTRLDFDGSA